MRAKQAEQHSADWNTRIDRGDPSGWRVVFRGVYHPRVRTREAARQCIRKLKRATRRLPVIA